MQVAEKYTEVRRAMADIFESNHRCYGYRRMQAPLSRQRVRLSEKVVQGLMKQECLVVAKPKRRRYGSYLEGDQSCAGKPRQPRLHGCCSE